MITAICLWWIGTQLNAECWYYVILLIGLVFRLWDSVREAKLNKRIREHL